MATTVLKPGLTIGNRYRIQQQLGQGESGHTYLCCDLTNANSPVSLRIMGEHDAHDGFAQLRRELSILGRFRHPQLVHFSDFGVMNRGRTPYLVREFVPGEDIFLGSAEWSLEQILDQLAGIGRVLQFLHARGVVCRRLRPSNIILHRANKGHVDARIVDFGMERRSRRGRSKDISKAYTAPEILLGHPGSHRSDLYSFGILAYQLLSRTLPFEDDDEGYLIQKHLQGKADMRPIERLEGGAGLAQALLCLLEKDPEKRPSSADDAVRLLSAASGHDFSGSISGSTEAYFPACRFVGREKEMGFLQERIRCVRDTGRGSTVFLTGESGAGKSRCLEELRTWALLEDWRIMESSCLAREDRAYGPYRRLLSHLEYLRPDGEEPDEGPIFRFDDPARIAEAPQFELSSGSAAGPFRDQLTREIVRLLSNRPTILFLHDFHWADEAVVTVLDYLTSDIQAHPIFLCVSLRPGETDQGQLARLMELSVRHHRAGTIALEPLPPAAVAEMIAGITSEKELGAEIAPWVHKSSGGNPFFVEEILKHLVDEKLLRRELGNWRLEMDKIARLTVPSGVASVLRQRLAQLSPGAREVAAWLAVFRRAVPTEQIRGVCLMAPEVLAGHLRELISKQIIRETAAGSFEFQHALISDVITEAQTHGGRRRMHRQIGEMLEKQAGDHDNHQELALHLMEGMSGDKSIRCALRAARSCKTEFANDLALRFYEYLLRHKGFLSVTQNCEIAIEAADTLCALGNPKRAIRILKAHLLQRKNVPPVLTIQLYTQLSRAYQYLGDMRRSKENANSGLAIMRSKKAVSSMREVETALLSQLAFCMLAESKPQRGLMILRHSGILQPTSMPSVSLGHLYILISALCGVACQFCEGVKASKIAIANLESKKAIHLLPMAYSHLGNSLAGLGKLGRAKDQFEKAMSIGEGIRSPYLLTQALCNLSECHCRMGQFDGAIESSLKATRVAEDTENWNLLAGSILCQLEARISTSEWVQAIEAKRLVWSRDIETMPVYQYARALYLSASLFVELGCPDSAMPELMQLERIGSCGTPIYETSQGEILKAVILRQAGNLLTALDSLIRLRLTASKNRWVYQVAMIKLELAETYSALERWDEAKSCVRNALRFANAMPAYHLQARGHYQLGRLFVERLERTILSGGEACNKTLAGDNELIQIASSELQKSLELSDTPYMRATCACVHYMLMRLARIRNDPDTALHHAQESLRMQALVESKVPEEFLESFRNIQERKQARTDCEAEVNLHSGPGGKSSLSIGEMEAEHLRILCQASGTINSIRDLNPLTGAICKAISKALKMQRALIFLWDEKAGRLCPVGSSKAGGEAPAAADSLSERVLQDVFHTGAPLVSADVLRDPRFASEAYGPGHGAVFCGPLVSCERTLGLVYADHREKMDGLNVSTINLFAAFCNMAAVAIENALAHQRLVEEKTELERYLRQAKSNYPEMVGKSEAMTSLRERIRLAADSPLDILINGESGTGKELVARALHRTGRRSAGRFVALDCGSLSDSLVESEFFGYRKGAFTGAVENKAGLFEAADGGVIFLDEISNLSLRLQRKLLRVLQEREVRRIGETTTRKINVQVIAATNRNLRDDILAGRFREDLFFRLCAMEIGVAPLRERREDIPLLLEWFLDQTGKNEGGRAKDFSQEARALLLSYPYPGNVRELKNIVEGSYYSTPGSRIEVAHIPSAVRDREDKGPAWEPTLAAWKVYKSIRDGLGRFDDLVKSPFIKRQIGCAQVRQVLHLALAETGGRYRDAFRLLGVPAREYAIVMQFIKRNDCYLDFRPYRKPRRSS